MIDVEDCGLLDTITPMSDDEVRSAAKMRWSACKTGSLLLAFLERLAPRDVFLAAAFACARYALPARSTPEPALARALDDAASGGDVARRAARDAYEYVSRSVAGVDDDVALAVMEACELVAGERFESGSTDPAGRAAWAWAWRRCGNDAARGDVEVMDAEVQHELADLVRATVGARWTP